LILCPLIESSSMKKKTKTGCFVLIMLFIVLGACAGYFVLNPKKAINLVLPNLNEISSVNINMKKDSVCIKLVLFTQNRMPYKMIIDTIHFEVKLEGISLTNETIPVLLNQSRFETDTIELPVHLSMKKIKNTISGIKGQEKATLEAEVYLVYKTFLGRHKVSINKKIEIPAPVPPQLKIVRVSFNNVKLREKKSGAIILLEIINNGPLLDFQLTDIYYDFQIKNTLSSKGKYQNTVKIKPHSITSIEIPMVLEFHCPLKTVWSVLRNKDKSKYDVRIKANINISQLKNMKPIPIEVEATGNVELMK
jgi:LEA14-like dessication related protein